MAQFKWIYNSIDQCNDALCPERQIRDRAGGEETSLLSTVYKIKNLDN